MIYNRSTCSNTEPQWPAASLLLAHLAHSQQPIQRRVGLQGGAAHIQHSCQASFSYRPSTAQGRVGNIRSTDCIPTATAAKSSALNSPGRQT